MSSDPNAPTDPNARTGGFVLKNLIYDATSKGEIEIMSHWRMYEGTRHVDQYNVPPFKPHLHRQHPCYDLNKILGLCADRLDPEMLLAGRVAACNTERQALMRCYAKLQREGRTSQGIRKNITGESVATTEGTWGSWIRGLF